MNSQNLSLVIVTFFTKASRCHGNYGHIEEWTCPADFTTL